MAGGAEREQERLVGDVVRDYSRFMIFAATSWRRSIAVVRAVGPSYGGASNGRVLHLLEAPADGRTARWDNPPTSTVSSRIYRWSCRGAARIGVPRLFNGRTPPARRRTQRPRGDAARIDELAHAIRAATSSE